MRRRLLTLGALGIGHSTETVLFPALPSVSLGGPDISHVDRRSVRGIGARWMSWDDPGRTGRQWCPMHAGSTRPRRARGPSTDRRLAAVPSHEGTTPWP